MAFGPGHTVLSQGFGQQLRDLGFGKRWRDLAQLPSDFGPSLLLEALRVLQALGVLEARPRLRGGGVCWCLHVAVVCWSFGQVDEPVVAEANSVT